MEKKGLEVAVTTVIMIVLSIAVLTILVIFLNSQTGFLSKWFGTYESKSNIDDVVTACNNLAAAELVYSYCCEEKEIIFGDKGSVDDEGNVVKRENLKQSCYIASRSDWSSGRINELDCVDIEC